MTVSEKFFNLFKKASINFSKVKVLGSYVHIDTFKKYEDQIVHVMTSAGFRLVMASDGIHLDGKNCFRMIFVLPQ